MCKVLYGVDPSFSRTGIACYFDGRIIINEVRGKEALGIETFSKSFEGIYRESKELSRIIEETMIKMNDIRWEFPDIYILSECPPPQGSYAPGLYALDIRLFDNFKGLTDNVYRVYPNYLMHLHGKRNYQKSESVELAQKILDKYEVELQTKRLSHDEAEAVIFLSRLLYKEGLLRYGIEDIIPNIKNEKEVLF